MNETRRTGCDLCGLRRLCFPGHVGGLRIRRVRIARGTALFRSGERIEALYMIRSGCIKEVDDGANRRETVVSFALPGEILSLQSLGCGVSRTSGIAVEASFVCVVPWTAFNQSCASSPKVAGEFIRMIARAGVAARDSLTLIRDKEAQQRVAGFLLNVLARMQFRGVRAREFRLGMNREDIADYLGMRSETVSRCFTELARRQLIQVNAKRVQIIQLNELRRVYVGA